MGRNSPLSTTSSSTSSTTNSSSEAAVNNTVRAREEKEITPKARKEKRQLTRAEQLRRRVFQKLPKDWKLSHKYYVEGYIHTFIWVITLILVYYYQYVFGEYAENEKSYNFNYFFYRILEYSLCMPFGWCFVAMISIGHDGIHDSFAPSNTKLGKFLNWLTVKLTWDVLVSDDFVEDHHFHHRYTNVKEDQSMVMVDWNMGVFGEIYQKFAYVMVGIFLEDWEILKSKKYNIFHKIIILILSINRALLMLGVYYKFSMVSSLFSLPVFEGIKLRFWIGVFNWSWGIYFTNFCITGGHVSPVTPENDKDGYTKEEVCNDMYLYQLHNTFELYPGDSWYARLQQFLHTGGTMHASHHCFTVVPKSLLYIISNELKEIYPNEYRAIYNIKDEWNMWHNRICIHKENDFIYEKKDIDNAMAN